MIHVIKIENSDSREQNGNLESRSLNSSRQLSRINPPEQERTFPTRKLSHVSSGKGNQASEISAPNEVSEKADKSRTRKRNGQILPVMGLPVFSPRQSSQPKGVALSHIHSDCDPGENRLGNSAPGQTMLQNPPSTYDSNHLHIFSPEPTEERSIGI